MSTLLHLEQQGLIAPYDPQLPPSELQDRYVYALPSAQMWITEKLHLYASSWDLENTPAEQVDDLLAHFCAGGAMLIGTQFKKLRHLEDGIWELKTADVRIFGWFFRRDLFIASNGGSAQLIKQFDLYEGYRSEAVRLRNDIDLDEPKFIPGDNPNDVVSNCAFP